MGFAPIRYSVLNSPVWLRSHRPPARKRPLVDGLKRSLPFPKLEVVLRVLRGEALDALSRELGVTAGAFAQWRDQVLAGGQAAVRRRPAFVREPEGTGCAERFGRALNEQLLWLEPFATVEALRLALLAFKDRYNAGWLIGRHGHRAPAAARGAYAPPHAA